MSKIYVLTCTATYRYLVDGFRVWVVKGFSDWTKATEFKKQCSKESCRLTHQECEIEDRIMAPEWQWLDTGVVLYPEYDNYKYNITEVKLD